LGLSILIWNVSQELWLGIVRYDLNIDLIFPMKDEVSAWLMCVKAETLYQAGIIDTDELNAVLERAAAVLDQAPRQAA